MSTAERNSLSPGQCRAGRAFVNWSRSDLARLSKVSERTLADFERGGSHPRRLTEDALIATFNRAGVYFVENAEYGTGVFYKPSTGKN